MIALSVLSFPKKSVRLSIMERVSYPLINVLLLGPGQKEGR